MIDWLKQDGQEIVGLGLLGVGLWMWWPPLCLVIVGGLLLTSALLRS